jgi:protein O-GlcNAc transferase
LSADRELAERLPSARDSREVLQLVAAWVRARGPLPAWGSLCDEERPDAVRAVARLRERLTELVAQDRLEPLAMPDAITAIYVWDRIFCNPLSAVCIGAPVAPVAGNPVLRALHEPMPPHVDDAGALVAAQPTATTKIITAIWLLGVPPHAVSAADRERFVAHAQSICAALPPLTMAVAAPLAYALTSNAFRASYGGGNTAPALAAIGRFIAKTMQAHFPAFATRPAPRARSGPIRLGYVSSYFRRHSVTSYMANRILCRDRSRFHVTLFAIGGKDDAVTAELAQSADRFVRVEPYPLERAAAAIRDAELDALVHVDIGMDHATHMLAGLYLAPHQLALMGHATSTGMPTISHYLSGDHEPADADAHYSEQLVRLPWCGAAQRPPPAPTRTFTRAELGIAADAVVLVSFAHALKHGADRDALYREILARAPRAHLVMKPFFSPEDRHPQLQARFAALGPRVTLVPALERASDLGGLYALADVQLDTYPFGGWTTNLDALHAGLPIVSQGGGTGRGRWGVRMLELCGAEIGRARNERELVDMAVALATDDALRYRVNSEIRGSSARFFDGPGTQVMYEDAVAAIIGSGEGRGA